MAHKAKINGKITYFNIWSNNRGDCMKCRDRGSCIFIRTMSTKDKKSLRICHSCLMKYLIYLEGVVKRAERAGKRIKKTRAKRAKAQKRIHREKLERKKKDERVLPKVLADVKSNVPPPEKEDGQNRDTGGRVRPQATA